ncbi:MAG: diacylglycerol kinase family lipid kinase [Bacteroidia bacterium]|nr:diacylglycerol kinase family lipid kinase [Bacteroidia bacterium]NND12158.1 diacylglycerol kinase family lipid kinase [Flavobacteriaceae bacterium]MBT8309201.1 diacylglycerol kinase family lipid kinase [Bacteroidia bacterium]NNK27287.1 diacylglycerol kinase family lipid kinase [Flavobacteriaceae bacterium]NNL61516.1 diacylglycerol kinase family lipid kinase [Flavobacteriaceae bacterium]
MKIVFIINNNNNRLAKVLPRLQLYCHELNTYSAKFVTTQKKKHAIALAKEATENNCDYLVAVGGDGTLHEIINGVLQSDRPANDYPAIGLLPYGSANDFARTAGISNSIEALFELIRSNTIQKIDLGKILLQQTQKIHYFINIASAGLGSQVVQDLEKSSNALGPKFNYFWHIIKGFLSYIKKEVNCSGGTWQWNGKLMQMAVANGRYFGNAICVAPDAKLSNGQFQVAIFGDLSIWDYLNNLGKLKNGIKIVHPQVYYHDVDELLIESTNSCGIEADGEYIGLTPAIISVLPKAISFIMPISE